MEDKSLKHLGLLIKQARANKKLSQEKLAFLCGMTKNGLGKIELSQSDVKIITLAKIFARLELDFSEIQAIFPHQKFSKNN
ncbi:MAG: helix-turn-helix protein [Burkholderiales bacterium]|jgi:transcriptional regulator with XRE-family HTH domain|nr:helix-turn-helix protein [Burkholderiales bacterium]